MLAHICYTFYMKKEIVESKNSGTSAFLTRKQLQKGGEDADVLVTNVGFSITHDAALRYVYPDDNHDYLLLYQHKGRVQFADGEDLKTMSDGGFLIVPPETMRNLYYLSDETNERYYVYFKGKKIPNVFRALSLSVSENKLTAFPIGTCSKVIDMFFDILNDFKTTPFENPFRRTLTLLNILTSLSDQSKAVDSISETIISPALRDMETDPFSLKQLKDYAHLCHLSEQTFIRHFKKEMHCSPGAYLDKVKINQIKNLLLSTQNPIIDIAVACNFIDPFYFSRFFKKHVGVSPRDYRAAHNDKKS